MCQQIELRNAVPSLSFRRELSHGISDLSNEPIAALSMTVAHHIDNEDLRCNSLMSAVEIRLNVSLVEFVKNAVQSARPESIVCFGWTLRGAAPKRIIDSPVNVPLLGFLHWKLCAIDRAE